YYDLDVFVISTALRVYCSHSLSLHDALPISPTSSAGWRSSASGRAWTALGGWTRPRSRVPWPPPRTTPPSAAPTACRHSGSWPRSEEHTSELQSRFDLVCRLLLEKKNTLRTL